LGCLDASVMVCASLLSWCLYGPFSYPDPMIL
jgi:hypothetical protein